MQRIPTLLQKLNELSQTDPDKISAIEIDLMLDYTRVLYADLLEWRNRVHFTASLTGNSPQQQPEEIAPAEADIPTGTAPAVELTQQINHYDTIEEQPPADHASNTVPLHDIRKKIGINDKYQFISELFSNNKEAYEAAMDKLNGFSSYEEAVNWLDENIHATYGWNDEQYTVQSFYELLNSFFASR